MGILKRIKDITLAEIHECLDRMEDPIAMLNHYLREMEEEIAKGEQTLANQMYLEKRHMAWLSNSEELIAKRARQAQLAVERGEEQIARLALQEKLIHEKNATLLKHQVEAIKTQTAILYEKLEHLKQQYDELKYKRLLLISRANTAQSIKRINQKVYSLDAVQLSKGFARMEERVLMMEAEAEASNHRALSGRNTHFYQVTPIYQEEVEKELEKLKGTNKETV